MQQLKVSQKFEQVLDKSMVVMDKTMAVLNTIESSPLLQQQIVQPQRQHSGIGLFGEDNDQIINPYNY